MLIKFDTCQHVDTVPTNVGTKNQEEVAFVVFSTGNFGHIFRQQFASISYQVYTKTHSTGPVKLWELKQV